MKKSIFFSKKLNDISLIKKNFTTQNKLHLQNILKINKLYSKQQKRIECKNCNARLRKKSFKSFLINYIICQKCEHLNGGHKESRKFLKRLYADNKGKNYSKNYLYNSNLRIKNIYLPKAKFYKKVLGQKKFLEMGSGNGFFLKACEKLNINGIGYETNKTMVISGQKILKKNILQNCKLEEIDRIIEKNQRECLVMIGVLEHVEDPNKILQMFKNSKSKYLYLSLPLFSFSTFLEHAFQNIYPRQLGGSHTHLYTKKSIQHFVKKFRFKIIGQWWFGQDFMDLKRSLLNSFKKENTSKEFLSSYEFLFGSHIDEFQKILDKKFISSETHIIFKK
jgi:hypothetical protein